ncbi:MAG: Acetylornithine deacetylase or succinyl-diaminopimelate desuccinylase [Acetothermia bacterium 64_32]|nr:MAG: Acetylornithine deacetylase or succinyl-diaminopimelate desuccinylase [Acetothermia bacterium 64_32]HAF70269.1 acetylornithine deacetylase [Candidatus Acetothermia bacterium]
MSRTALEDRVVKLATELLSIPSHQSEAEVARFLAHHLQGLGCQTILEEVEPGRPNLIALLKGPRAGRTLMFCGHLDTVPPASQDQLRPRIEGGRVYGRGSCDMKGALAAMVCAIESLADQDFAGTLMLLATMGEETGLRGMRHFMARSASRYTIDACIVGEPTSLELGIAHKGGAWLELTTFGKAAHGSTPDQGINAIYHMALVVKAVQEDLVRSLSKKEHPLLGPGTVNVGVIRGGERANMVPDRCALKVDRRFLPGESVEQVVGELEGIASALKEGHPDLQVKISLEHWYPPFEVDEGAGIVRAVREAYQAVVGNPPPLTGLNYGTDGTLTQAGGIPTVIIGPGAPAQAHTENEFVKTGELGMAARIYREAALRFLR